MYTKFFVIFLLSFVLLLCAGENDRFTDMSPQKIDALIRETSAKPQTITEKMNYYSHSLCFYLCWGWGVCPI